MNCAPQRVSPLVAGGRRPGRAVTLVAMTTGPAPAPWARTHHLPRAAAAAVVGLLSLTACAGDAPADDDPAEQEEAQDEQAELEEAREEAEQAREAALAGPGEEHREQAAELVAQLSVQERAGQVLVGEYSGTDAAGMAEQIEELHLAGAIVMGGNVPGGESDVDIEALTGELEKLQEAAAERGYPAVISVDQEGGLVTRVGEPLAEWPAPMAYGAAHQRLEGDGLALQGHRFMGLELADLGFTVSFTPNADVTIGSGDPTMGSRSFGAESEAVSELALAGIRGLADGGLAGSVKHFPGHGSVTEDSHNTLPVQDAGLEELRERDWAPFAAAAEAGAPMMMMGHIDVPDLEEGVPSSLSPAAYEELREMGHEGVVVTDALNMEAIVSDDGPDQAPLAALEAGADLLLMPSDVAGAHEAIVAAVESGDLPEERLEEAAERVVALMLWQQDLAAGELHAGPGAEVPEVLREEEYPWLDPDYGDDAGEDSGEGQDHDSAEDEFVYDSSHVAYQLSSSAVTLVAGECEADLASEGITIMGGDEQDQARLTAAAEAAGVPVGQGTTVNLLGGSQGSPGGEVAVALDRPEALEAADAPTQIALYGRTAESFEALIAVLSGVEAPGALPVPVDEHEPGHSVC